MDFELLSGPFIISQREFRRVGYRPILSREAHAIADGLQVANLGKFLEIVPNFLNRLLCA